jgi:hypothetical protein
MNSTQKQSSRRSVVSAEYTPAAKRTDAITWIVGDLNTAILDCGHVEYARVAVGTKTVCFTCSRGNK